MSEYVVTCKKFLESLYDLCDMIDDKFPFGIKQVSNGETLSKECLRVEILQFLAYLSASDGVVSSQEARFVRDILGWNLTTDYIAQFINENNIYSTDFENKVPIMMQVLVETDNAIYEIQGVNESLGSEAYYNFLESLGTNFLACDDVDENEVADLSTYLTMLRNYIQENVASKNRPMMTQQKVDSDEAAIEDLLMELDSLIGLVDVKKDVNSLINLIKIRKIREERGLKQTPMSLHMVFSGNPGTGKTTVARLLAEIYHKLGVLSKGHLVEVDRSGLVGGYVGQTAIKVQEVIQKSLGGILFIDEAYSLTANKSENDYGIEAVDILLKGMEDHRDDLVVIVAGYPDLMDDFLNANPGLRSRFNKFIKFEDYNPDELFRIFNKMCSDSGYGISVCGAEYVKRYFEKKYLTRDANFANGRYVRNFFEVAMVNQANRLSMMPNISNRELTTFELCDLENIEV